MKTRQILLFVVVAISLILIKYSLLGEEFISVLLWILSMLLVEFLRKKYFNPKGETDIDGLILSEVKRKFIRDSLRSQAAAHSKSTLRVSANNNLEYIETLNWRLHEDGRSFERYNGSLYDLFEKIKSKQKGNFIIFGESGVGKTFAVFDYIEKRIVADPNFTPIFLSLSDWDTTKPFLQWTIGKAAKIYHLDRISLETALKRGLIFPIYDGLDRVKDENILLLFGKLMEMASKMSLAVVMKTEAYEKLSTKYSEIDGFWKLPFNVIELKTLNPKLVETLLKSNGDPRKLEIFRSNSKFKFLCRYPLFLNLLIGMESRFIKEQLGTEPLSHDQFFNQVWRWYEQKMLDSSNFTLNPKKVKLKKWLRKIAINSGLFFPEELQPSYLDSKWAVVTYYLGSRLFGATLVAVAAGLFLAGPFDFWDSAVLGGMTVALIDLIKVYFISTYTMKKSLFKANDHKLIPPASNILKKIIPLISVLGIYYGFTTPRSPHYGGEMLMDGLFSSTEAVVGIIIGILLSIFFGARSNWQQHHFDIKPVERIIGSLKNYFISGFTGGLLLAIIVVLIFYFFNLLTNDVSSINAWLNQELYIGNKYLFTGFAGFLLGYLFFGLFGFLQGNKVILEHKEKLRFSKRAPITKSFVNALKSALVATLVTAALLGAYIGLTEMEVTAVFKAFKAAVGFGVLAFAWFGGLDAVCHWLLRFILAFEEGFPIHIRSFLLRLSEIGFVRPVGSGYEFIHPSLRDYYKSAPVPVKSKKNMYLIPIALIVLLSVPILLKLVDRFRNESHWQNEYGYTIKNTSNFVHPVNGSKNKFVISGLGNGSEMILKITATGKVKLGSFLGFVSPAGTKSGFLGMSIGETWNKTGLEKLNHGALVFRKNNGNWIGFPENDLINLGNSTFHLTFTVKNGDLIETVINDKEWENNSGKFNVTFENTIKMIKPPKIVAHRGGAATAAENSIEAIKKSLTLGVDIVEIDIRMSKDGHLVLMHDRSVDRTTNGKGLICNLRLEEIQELHLIKSDSKEPVPTLDEVLEVVSSTSAQLLIEVKTHNDQSQIVKKLVQSVKEKNMEERVMIFSFDKSFCKELKERFPELTVGVFVFGPSPIKKLPKVDAIGVEYHSLLLFGSWLKKLRDNYSKVYAWNVNSRSSMQQLTDKNITGIITDNPEELKILLGH
ncbi:glycerophosphodiester phosphodiesterase family protein [Arenibacter sp. GZD96]|uniref:glycerophosphodiester phosphodiesterase family protein n=1 Tax=Aurantibrevibacter litoralis TaxID=3106030 RepID=UPI002B0034D3|nr:glycerophosphodiester phosphodiesterase family protein [Arenibacter sp. GZD-96]MEA1785147.1 glycerophosphodiester phosphodiesterase family protein [Arenibacter sp. GZD-96]